MGSSSSYTAKQNLVRQSQANADSTVTTYTGKQNLIRHSQAASDSKATTYTNRVNVSRLSGINADAFVRNASLLARLGGEMVLESYVRYFYGKALQSPVTNRLFDAPDAISMENRIQKQISYLKAALGGMDDGKIDMAASNAYLSGLGVSNEQFNGVVDAITATLRSQNVQPEVIEEVVLFCDRMRGNIVR